MLALAEYEFETVLAMSEEQVSGRCNSVMVPKKYYMEPVDAASARTQSFHDKKHLLKKLRKGRLEPMSNEPQAFMS